MRHGYKKPKELALDEKKERFSLLVPKEKLEKLRRVASQENITVASLINEAIRGYLEYLEDCNDRPNE